MKPLILTKINIKPQIFTGMQHLKKIIDDNNDFVLQIISNESFTTIKELLNTKIVFASQKILNDANKPSSNCLYLVVDDGPVRFDMVNGRFLLYSKNIYSEHKKYILKFSAEEKLQYLTSRFGDSCKKIVYPYLSDKNIVELTNMIRNMYIDSNAGSTASNHLQSTKHKEDLIHNGNTNVKADQELCKRQRTNSNTKDEKEHCHIGENKKEQLNISKTRFLFPKLTPNECYIVFGIYKHSKLADVISFLCTLHTKFSNTFLCYLLVNQLVTKKIIKKSNQRYYIAVSHESLSNILCQINFDVTKL